MSGNLHRRVMEDKIMMPPLRPSRPPLSSASMKRSRRSYKPAHWSRYFQDAKFVEIGESKFRVYSTRSSSDVGEMPTLVLIHGGGYSGLTWSVLAKELVKLVGVRILAVDLRGHGETETPDDSDISIETIAKDAASVIDASCEDGAPVILVGHSMGGALAVHVSEYLQKFTVSGLVVIDVVEGTALDALGSMQNFLRGRPNTFESLSYAIEWSLRSGQTRNLESACVSMPGQLKHASTNEPATKHVSKESSVDEEETNSRREGPLRAANSIAEEEDGEEAVATVEPTLASVPSREKYTWRIDLSKTENKWPGWFKGLSSKFLSIPAAKMLILAGIDRLDKDLTVGQMQGKFQMQVLPQAGHAIHEDVPDRVAEVLATFLVRNKFAKALADFNPSFPAC